MTAWGSTSIPAPTMVAVVTEQPEIAQAVASRLPATIRIYKQHFEVNGELLQAERIAKEIMLANSTIVCFGPDVPLALSFEVAELIDRDHPDVTQIVITGPTGDIWREALRTGVRELVSPSALDAELDGALARSIERATRVRDHLAAAPSAPTTGRVIVVLSPKGGAGKTMIATNLAVCLAQSGTGSVAFVDLDVQFGDAASSFGLLPENTLAELAAEREIDSTVLKVYLTPHDTSGVFVLCGAGTPEEGEAVTEEHAQRVLRLLMRDFAYVVVDTSAGLDETALASLEQATDVVLVSSLDVSSIRSLGKEMQALDRLGLLSIHRHFVLNRADSRVGLEVADVETTLGLEVDAAVPSSRLVPLSMNQGRPIAVEEPNSPVAVELTRFARRFTGQPEPARRPGRSFLRGRRSS